MANIPQTVITRRTFNIDNLTLPFLQGIGKLKAFSMTPFGFLRLDLLLQGSSLI